MWSAVAIAAGLVLVGASPGVAAAAPGEDVTWSVVPADENGSDSRSAVEIELGAGESVTEHLAVRNLGEAEATFQLGAADGYYTENGRFTTLPAGTESTDAGTWVSLPDDVTVDAGETAVIPFEVVIPDEATPGDHAAGIFASVRSVGPSEGSTVGVESRVGFRALVRVEGELAPALTIDDASANYTTQWNPFRPGTLSTEYTVTNTGNVALALTDELGGTTGDRGDLLPGESRAVSTDPSPTWPLFVAGDALTVSGTAPGDADLTASAEANVSTLAIPWAQLVTLAGLALLVIAIVGGRRRSTARLERAVEQAREEGRRESGATGHAQ